jgi:CDP-diacylglycerol--serine O-phosphatidyltransferase
VQHQPNKLRSELSIAQILPNLVTVTAICAGLTSIRFAVQGNFELAVQLILAASFLDLLDGKLARMLMSESKMGAELDSLADFVNFGVAPPLLIYFWALQDMRSAAWISVLVFAVCCVLRLARFNVSNKAEIDDDRSGYLVGVPAPAGAGLVMMPMFLSFAADKDPIVPPIVVCVYMICIGLLLISRIRTWSFKALTISRKNVKFVIVGFAFMGALVLTYAWITLFGIGLAYAALALWTSLVVKPELKPEEPVDPQP